ncbi:hypothetical protein L7F22_067805 [Adiantum nelumboides]|nr:hypothetical protein [Adiantum nelumboides]
MEIESRNSEITFYEHIGSTPERNISSTSGVGGHLSILSQAHKQKMFKDFECKLKQVKYSALLTACFYSANRFLGFCALTWASAVILGALLSQLSSRDFYPVTFLLLLIAVRLFIGICFGHYITRKLMRDFHDPTFTVYNHHNVPFSAKKHSDILFAIFRMLDQAIQVAIIVFDAIFACRRFHAVLVRPNNENTEFNVIDSSLLIFYGIASLDGLIAFLAVVHCKILILLYVQSYSLRDYYDEMVCRYMNIFWTGMGNEMLFASDYDILTFVFRSLAQSYRQRSKEFLILKLYEDVAVYVYSCPQGQGFEAARVALLSNDAYARKAAVNMLCLWADMDTSEEIIRHQKNLLSALAQALQDNIQGTGHAAALCFERLGKKDALRILGVKSVKSGEKLAHILIDLVSINVFEWEEENESKVYIRALIPLMSLVMERINSNAEPASCSREKLVNLRQALTQILQRGSDQNKHIEKGTLAVTAYAFRIIYSSQFSISEVDSLLRAVPNRSGQEVLLPEEQEYLSSLLRSPDRGFSMEWSNRVVTPGPPKWPIIPWIARRNSFFALAFLIVAFALGLFFYAVVYSVFRLSMAAALPLLFAIHSAFRFLIPIVNS